MPVTVRSKRFKAGMAITDWDTVPIFFPQGFCSETYLLEPGVGYETPFLMKRRLFLMGRRLSGANREPREICRGELKIPGYDE